MAQDYYETLQVHPRADTAAITAAYERLRALYDPARLEGAADELVALAQEKRGALNRAYAVLSDQARRAAYDAELGASGAPAEAAAPAATPAAPAAPSAATLDYRPLPPARRAERPRGFNAQPTAPAPRSAAPARAGQAGPSGAVIGGLIAAGALVIVVLVSALLTGGGGGAPQAAPTATASPLDQYEARVQQTFQVTQQRPTDAQAWVDYGNALYDSVQVLREGAPDSTLYRQRLPRWLQATDAYSQALSIDPSNAAVRSDLGASACFYGAGAGDQSYVSRGIGEIRQAAQALPDDPRVQLNLGYCLISTAPPQTQEALQSWRRVVSLAPASSPLATEAQRLISQYDR